MKKEIIILLAIFVMTGCSSVEKKEVGLKETRLYNSNGTLIKYESQETKRVAKILGGKSEIEYYDIVYDDEGKIISESNDYNDREYLNKEMTVHKDVKKTNLITFEYQKGAGERVDVKTEKHNGEIVAVYEYKYSEDGVRLQEIKKNRRGETEYINTFNKMGELLEEERHFYEVKDGKSIEKSVMKYNYEYKYDKNGMVTSRTVKDNEGKKLTDEYTYDAKGKVIRIERHDESGNFISKTLMYYDAKGNKTEKIFR